MYLEALGGKDFHGGDWVGGSRELVSCKEYLNLKCRSKFNQSFNNFGCSKPFTLFQGEKNWMRQVFKMFKNSMKFSRSVC